MHLHYVILYREVFPLVHQELDKWKRKAETIQNPELKTQAKASIRDKTFHCEGGGIMALLSGDKIEQFSPDGQRVFH